jgi:hypothetical protein
MAGSWYIDGYDLSTLATNVELRSAGWTLGPKRGENRQVPGRFGSVYRKKIPDESEYNFEMWVQGCDIDGTVPVDIDADRQMRNNLDELTRRFGGSGLHEFARTFDDSIMFGRVNLLPNPSMEDSNGKVVVQENVIGNPSVEYSDGTRVFARRNFADNPNMEDGNRESVFRTNWFRNPRMASEGRISVYRTNLLPNPSLEAALTPWQDGSNGTASRSNKAKNDGTYVWPVSGRWSLKVTSKASGDAGCPSGPFRVLATTTYAFMADVYNATGASRVLRLKITWRSKVGAVLATDTISSASLADEVVSTLTGTKTSPANAYTCTVSCVIVGTAAAGEVAYFDRMLVEQAAAVTTYFDGNSPESNGFRHRWKDESGGSPSEEFMVAPLGMGAGVADTNRYFGLTTEHLRIGSKSLRVEARASISLNGPLFKQQPAYGAELDPLEQCSALFWAKQYSSIAATRTVKMQLACYDSKGNLLGLCMTAGADMTPVTTTLSPGEWVPCVVDNVQVRKGTASVCIEALAGETWSIGDGVYFDTFLTEMENAAGLYFDGNTVVDDTFAYEWVDDPQDSPSQQIGIRVAGWSLGVQGSQYRVAANPVFGDYCMRLVPKPSPNNTLPYTTQGVLRVRDATSHTASVYVTPNTTRIQEIGISWDGGDTWTTANASCAGGATTRLSVTATSPAVADEALTLIRVGYQQGSVNYSADTDTMDYDALLFAPEDSALTWFSGNSGKGFSWEDEEFRSVSIAHYDEAKGYHPYGAGKPIVYREKGVTGSLASDANYYGTVLSLRTGVFGVTTGQDGVTGGTTYAFGIDIRTIGSNRNMTVGITWYDSAGQIISSSTASVACVTTAWTRCAVSAAAPGNAVIGAPYVQDSLTTPNQSFNFDAAIFGFGASSTYKDGNSASWSWTGVKNKSTSENKSPQPSYTFAEVGTYAQSAAFATNRTNSGLFTTTGGGGRLLFLNKGEGSRSSFRIKDKRKKFAFAADVKATEALRITPALVPRLWDGWKYVASGQPVVFGTAVDIGAGSTVRVSMYDTPDIAGVATNFVPALYVFASGGGAVISGKHFAVDSAILTDFSSVTTYQDGEDANVVWKGDKDQSASIVASPARTLHAEVRDMIDFTTSGSGTLARFTVTVHAPGVYWKDAKETITNYIIGRSGSIVTLTGLAGSTAPIIDAKIRINGPISPCKLTDMGSGSWIRIKEKLDADESAVIDVDKWTVKDEHGKSMISKIVKSDSPYLLQLENEEDEAQPRIKVEADNIGRGANLVITARRKFHIA